MATTSSSSSSFYLTRIIELKTDEVTLVHVSFNFILERCQDFIPYSCKIRRLMLKEKVSKDQNLDMIDQ